MKEYTSIPGAGGLPDRRHPYRAETAADRSRLTTSTAAVCTWAMGVIAALLGRARIRDEATRDDLQQDALLHLIDHSLPRYDADNESGACLETYLFSCLSRAIRMGLRTRRRAGKREAGPITDTAAHAPSPIDELIAREVSSQLRAVLERPEEHVGPEDARAILAWLSEQAQPGQNGRNHRKRVRRRMHSTYRRAIAPALEK